MARPVVRWAVGLVLGFYAAKVVQVRLALAWANRCLASLPVDNETPPEDLEFLVRDREMW
jgi:hypothetical protein